MFSLLLFRLIAVYPVIAFLFLHYDFLQLQPAFLTYVVSLINH
jgi:hypothetical protein